MKGAAVIMNESLERSGYKFKKMHLRKEQVYQKHEMSKNVWMDEGRNIMQVFQHFNTYYVLTG